MFEKWYPIPKDCHRHEQGPFAKERATILAELEAKSYSPLTIRNYAKDLLRAANYIASDLECRTYDDYRIEQICKNSRKHCIKSFKVLAVVLGIYKNDVCFSDDNFAQIAQSYLDSKTNTLREETMKSYRYFLRKLCRFFGEHKIEISSLHFSDIDDFLETCKSFNPHTKRLIYSRIIDFLKFCEKHKVYDGEIASCILRPRIWGLDSLPAALPWSTVEKLRSKVFASTTPLRDDVIIMLLSTYGLRGCEVRRLKIEDVVWKENIIYIRNRKNHSDTVYPLDVSVGNAIVDYLCHERPKIYGDGTLFLTATAPYHEISISGFTASLRRRIFTLSEDFHGKRIGSHSFRHSVAQYLLHQNISYKDIGNQLGHNSLRSTQIYAKLDIDALKLVQLKNLDSLMSVVPETRTCKPKEFMEVAMMTKLEVL